MNLNEDDYRHAIRLRYVESGLNRAEALELVELTECQRRPAGWRRWCEISAFGGRT